MSWLEAFGVFRRPPDARSVAEIEADVRAEIEHHLACKERELVERGCTTEHARAVALERFGDPASARAACVRIQTGERIMLQRIHFVVTILLLLAVLVLTWSTNRSSQAAAQAAEVAAALRAEMGARAAQEREAPEPVADVIVEVGDKIQFIDEFNPNEIKGVVDVAEDGKIPLPHAGWVFVAGLTREQVEEALTKSLAPYFVESEVRVIVKKKASSFESTTFTEY